MKQYAKAQYWIKKFDMKEHPEGGYFAETFKSPITTSIPGLGVRSLSSNIYFLLKGNQFSAFHRMKTEEIWHFYAGSTLTLHAIGKDGEMKKFRLGSCKDCNFQMLVEPGVWFAATVDNPKSYCLVGCTVSPGFDYDDWELADKDELVMEFPEHKSIITRLTRSSKL